MRSLFISGLALVTCCLASTGANAALLTATTQGPNGSFTIDFTDSNNNGLFDLPELNGFSGFTSVFGDNIVVVLGVPAITGISVAGELPGATTYPDPSYWNFEEAGGVDNSWDLASDKTNWTYQITGLNSTVPEPASLALLGLGLAGLGLGRRRKVRDN